VGSSPFAVLEFPCLHNPSSLAIPLEFTYFLTEMCTSRNGLVGKARPARKADSLTAIYEPIV
jgi:hypothetical protein